MGQQIPVYSTEYDLGLAEKISSSGKLAYATVLSPTHPFVIPSRITKMAKATNEGQLDLHYLSTILVSTGWNKNDDVFDRTEVWVARATPEDKPFNYEHNCADIIGHITSNWALGEDDKVIDDGTAVDKLPAKYHIATGAVLYKFWEDAKLQERMDAILADVAKGNYFVSMECLFNNFDYALRAKDGTSKVIARNEATAFLTKHLRAYGGNGVYQEYVIGRLLRNILFSGKGLVKNPANPESIIFSKGDFQLFSANTGYASLTELKTSKAEKIDMSEALEKQVADLKVENDRLAVLVKTNDEKNWKAQVTAKDDQLVALTAAKTKAETDLKGLAEQLTDTNKKLTETVAALTTAQEEISKAALEKKTASRVNILVDELKLERKDAELSAANLLPLTDEQFLAHVKAMTAWVTNNPQSGNTTFSGPTPKPTPKNTPGSPTPKATDKAAGADLTAVLDTATPKNDATLQASVTVVEDEVRQAIAKHLGFIPEGENK